MFNPNFPRHCHQTHIWQSTLNWFYTTKLPENNITNIAVITIVVKQGSSPAFKFNHKWPCDYTPSFVPNVCTGKQCWIKSKVKCKQLGGKNAIMIFFSLICFLLPTDVFRDVVKVKVKVVQAKNKIYKKSFILNLLLGAWLFEWQHGQ